MMNIKRIGILKTDFPTKFGLPRQSGISDNIKARLIFEPEFRDESCIRGLEGFNYVWVIRGSIKKQYVHHDWVAIKEWVFLPHALHFVQIP